MNNNLGMLFYIWPDIHKKINTEDKLSKENIFVALVDSTTKLPSINIVFGCISSTNTW